MTILGIPAETASGYGFRYRGSDGTAGRMSCAWPLFCEFLSLHYRDQATLICAGDTSSFSLRREANLPASSVSGEGVRSAMPTRGRDGDR